MVRVPLHALSSKIDYDFNKNLRSSLLFTYKGRTRDYGTADQGCTPGTFAANCFRDQILDEYFLVDLKSSYKINNNYKFDFSLKNLFDKDYENSNLYTGTPRTINVGLNKSF